MFFFVSITGMAPLGEIKLMFLFVSITGEATTGAESCQVKPMGLESCIDDPCATCAMLLLGWLLATTGLPKKVRCPWDCAGKEVVVAEMFASTGFILATSETCTTLADCISERVCTGDVGGDRTYIVCPWIGDAETTGDCDTSGGTDRTNGMVACCW